MSKYLVAYTLPVRHRRRVVDAPSPETGAKLVRDKAPGMEDVVIQDLENEEDDVKEVYEWCEICNLPIWIDDGEETYMLVSEEHDTWAHTACTSKDVH